jgi:hypothetical protein
MRAWQGAIHSFEGSKSGTGRIEIVDAVAPSQVTIAPDDAQTHARRQLLRFTLEPKRAATIVTWAMDGRTPLLGKVVGLVIDCDRLVGKVFAEGLANLRAIAETPRGSLAHTGGAVRQDASARP